MNRFLRFSFLTLFILLSQSLSSFNLSGVSHLYLVGGATPWTWDRGLAPELSNRGDGIYTWTGSLGVGDFKFLISRNTWDSLVADEIDQPVSAGSTYNIRPNAEGADHDYKWYINQPGSYTLTVDLTNATLTVSTPWIERAHIYPCIKADSSSWKCCKAFTQGEFVVTATDGKETRYLAVDPDNSFSYVKDIEDATFFAVNSAVEEKQVLIDTERQSIECRDYQPWGEVYLCGDFNTWALNKPMTHDADNPNVYTWVGSINIGRGKEVNLLARSSDGNRQMTVHPLGADKTIIGHGHIGVDTESPYKWLLPLTDYYTLSFDLFNLTCYNQSTLEVTGLSESSADIEITAYDRQITVNCPADTPVAIYTPEGRSVAIHRGPFTHHLTPGLYLIATPTHTRKLLLP